MHLERLHHDLFAHYFLLRVRGADVRLLFVDCHEAEEADLGGFRFLRWLRHRSRWSRVGIASE